MKSLDGINGRRSIQNVTEGVITTRSNRMKFRLTRGKSWMAEKKNRQTIGKSVLEVKQKAYYYNYLLYASIYHYQQLLNIKAESINSVERSGCSDGHEKSPSPWKVLLNLTF